MIPAKKAKQIREELGLTHLVIFGITPDSVQHIATHGKTRSQAAESALFGNHIKHDLGWPLKDCQSKPLERKCENCDYWQRGYHRPGDVIEKNMHGKCMFNPEPIKRFEEDRACGNFEPSI